MEWGRLSVFLLAMMSLAAPGLCAESDQTAWAVDRKTGCRVWNQIPEENEAVTWSGACRNGSAQGRGVLQWVHDDQPTERYEGQVSGGKPNGHGVLTMRNGDRYEGEWRDGKADGPGQIVLKSGYTYTGVWFEGCVRVAGNSWIGVGRDPRSCY